MAFLAMSTFSLPEPAHAQFGLFIPRMGGFGMYGGRGCRNCGGRHSGSSESSGDDSSGSRSDRSDRPASLEPPPSKIQNTLLHIVAQLNPDELRNGSGDDSTSKAVSPLGKVSSKEGERDWTQKVQEILGKFQKKQAQEGRGVTTFLGENWSGERIRVMILDRVWAEVDTLFGGNSRGYAPMQEVDNIIQRAAQQTYRRIFEVSELLAANRGSALFMQRLYQTHGGLVDNQMREVVDDMITRTATSAIGKFQTALRQNENGYALRYRAERIVFDCLSDNVEKISSSETNIAEKGEIAQRIDATAKSECVGWIENQFGTDNRALKPQTPMPLRVVWSATGPKDDPSMYGQAASELR
jgi:hypothetical protein